jgi:CubicO group peptidase (beta-lactamase class C family)
MPARTDMMAVQALIDGAVARGVPGIVAMIAGRDEAHVVVAGEADREAGVPMRRDTIFRLASMTKPVLAAATMMLADDGMLALGDPIDRWLPELVGRRVLRAIDAPLDETLRAARTPTVHDLLACTFGLGAFMVPADTYPIQSAMAARGLSPGAAHVGYTPDACIAAIAGLPLARQPGEAWLYHTSYDVLAVLLARATRTALPDLLAERLFAPLGMVDTGFHVPAGKLDRLAVAYAADAAGALAVWDPAAGSAFAAPPLFPNNLVSTADDYLAFARMILADGVGPRGRLLSADAVQTMRSDRLTPAQKALSPFAPGFWDTHGWGLGAAVTIAEAPGGGDGRIGSYGWSGGIGTHMHIDPAAGQITMLLTQKLMQGPDDSVAAQQLVALAGATERERV